MAGLAYLANAPLPPNPKSLGPTDDAPPVLLQLAGGLTRA